MKNSAKAGALVASAEQKNAVATATTKPTNIKELLEARMGEIQKVLPSVLTPTQFLRLALNAIQTTPHLMECTMQSFYGSIMQCAQLGLKPNCNGEAYLLPFKNTKKGGIYECQFVPGYKGLMLLARRSGEIASIDAQTVYENDTFELSFGFEPALIHKPYLEGDRGAVRGFYATVILKDGGKSAHWMTVEDAKNYGKRYSKAYSSGPWQTDFEAMAKKSCLRQVLKYAPMSTDVDTAIERDGKVLRFDDNKIDGNVITIDDEEPTEGAPVEGLEEGATVDEDGVVHHANEGETEGNGKNE
ncbi:MAG: recombinase RecT [Clostridia bacterium]|nr:recombinase RecT [Clostridia bacterium]